MSDDLEFLNIREKYIPIRVNVLLDRILGDHNLTEGEQEQFKTFTQMIGQRFHFDFFQETENLQNCFVPFDPDCDTVCNPELAPEQRLE